MIVTVKGYRRLELINDQQTETISSLKQKLEKLTGELEVLEEVSNVLDSIIKLLEK